MLSLSSASAFESALFATHPVENAQFELRERPHIETATHDNAQGNIY